MEKLKLKNYLVLAGFAFMVFTNCDFKKEIKVKEDVNLSEKNEEQRKKWEASVEAQRYLEWEKSPAGIKIKASHAILRNQLNQFQAMSAIVRSLTYIRPDTRGGSPRWLLVTIGNETYMLQFNLRDFQKFKSVHVGDTLTLKSRFGSYSHNHPYLILSSDYIANGKQVIFEKKPSKGKC